jgi:hypothetical protein
MERMRLDELERCAGLYVYDHGDWTAVGQTADEIRSLLESERTRGGRVYRIQRVSPDGSMELRGVAAERFQLESGMFFNRRELWEARTDFEALRRAVERIAPPCRAFVHLAERTGGEAEWRYVTALVYPAECEDDIASWLTALDYQGGELIDAGISHVTQYYAEPHRVVDRLQLMRRPAEAAGAGREGAASGARVSSA